MKFPLRAALLLAAVTAAACTEPVDRVCPALPEIEFTPDVDKGYGVKDDLKATISPYAVEDGHRFACAAKVCFTLDGSEPQEGRASTYCYDAPVKDIPIRQSTCIKYYVVGADGSQSTTQQACYRVEPPPVSTCDPNSKSSREPIAVSLVSSKAGSIFYTLDGSDPDPENTDGTTTKVPTTSAQVKIDDEGTTTLKFRAVDKDGNLEEQVNTCEYKYDATPPETLATPEGKTSTGSFQVTLSASELSRIYYTTDGSEPDPQHLEESGLGSTQVGYSEATLNIDHSMTVRYYSIDYVGNEETPKSQNYFVGGKPIVNVTPGPGPYVETAIAVELAVIKFYATGSTTQVWYTTDNSTPIPGTSGTKLYSAPITEFNREGEYTLKYRAYEYKDAVLQDTGVFTVTYVLGSTGTPFYPKIDFTLPAQYNEAASSRSVEFNPAKGFARLRRKIPARVGAGVDSIGTANPYDMPQGAAIYGSSLILATGNELRVYPLEQYTPSGTKGLPEDPVNIFFDACSNTKVNGALLGVNVFANTTTAGTTVYAATPFTSRSAFNNCGGFAKFRLNYGTASVREYSKPNLSQFAGPQNDPWQTDFEEVNEVSDPNIPNLPRAAAEVVDGFADDVFYLPRYRTNNYYVDGYYTSNGAAAITSTTIIAGRPTALKANPVGTWLAVGDTAGHVYTLNAANLDKLGEQTIPCPTGDRCRVNGLAWYIDGLNVYLIAAVGHYGGAEAGGKIALFSVAVDGQLTMLSDSALPDSDPYQIHSTPEDVAMAPDGDHAVLSVRDQGIVVLNLDGAAGGTVAARGYATGADWQDNLFWAQKITPYPGTTQNRAVVLDVGRSAQALDAGFQIFDFSNAEKWETEGTWVSTNINGDKPVNRVRLVAASPDPLPAGVEIHLIADGTELAQPIDVNTEIAFPQQPTDVRVKIHFSSTDGGASTVQVNLLRFKFTPAE